MRSVSQKVHPIGYVMGMESGVKGKSNDYRDRKGRKRQEWRN